MGQREADIIYGRHPVQMALRAQPQAARKLWLQQGTAAHAPALRALEARAAELGLPVAWASRQTLAALTGAPIHQGVALQMRAFAYAELTALVPPPDTPALLVALDGVQDPHNLGALLRSAWALGAHGAVLAKDRACPVTGVVVKAAAGATAELPVARVVNLSRALATLKARGLWVVGSAPDGAVALADIDLRGPIVIVVGAEGGGMRRNIRAACDYVAHIPMHQAGRSLNAAVAGSLLCYEALRQRRAQGGAA